MKSTENPLDALKAEAAKYTGASTETDRDIQLKIDHTVRVAAETEALCAAEHFSAEEHELAAEAAWFHDLSRFEQLHRFGTFMDNTEFDHGRRSMELLAELPRMRRFSGGEREAVLQAVLLHNKRRLPDGLPELTAKTAAAVRDCDKTDILHLLLNEIDASGHDSIFLNLDRSPRFSPGVAETVGNGGTANYSDMRTVCDFVLNMMFWVRDLNYRHTCEVFRERKYLDILSRHLPETAEAAALAATAQRILADKCGSNPER